MKTGSGNLFFDREKDAKIAERQCWVNCEWDELLLDTPAQIG